MFDEEVKIEAERLWKKDGCPNGSDPHPFWKGETYEAVHWRIAEMNVKCRQTKVQKDEAYRQSNIDRRRPSQWEILGKQQGEKFIEDSYVETPAGIDAEPIDLDSDAVGSFPIRQDIYVRDEEEPRKLKLGWVVYEEIGVIVVNDYNIDAISMDEKKTWKSRLISLYRKLKNGGGRLKQKILMLLQRTRQKSKPKSERSQIPYY